MEKYLIAIDLDGTLRHDDGSISSYSREVIETLKSKGHIIVTATARGHKHALKVNDDIFKSDYLVCLSGSEVYDIKKEKVIHEELISKDNIKRLYEYAKKEDIRISFSSGKDEYITKYKRYDSQVLLEDDTILDMDVKEVLVIDSNKEKVAKFYREMKDMNIVLNGVDAIEPFFIILANNSNKGYGIKKLAEYLNIDNILSFGNDENDIPMFNNSTIAVAVDNADIITKNAANIIIESNNDDAVCKYLSKKFI